MEKRLFGNTHRQVAVIGQGTWNMDEADPTLAVAAMRRGLDRGMTHIDCAEMYGSGAAEKLVGEAISSRRDEVFLVSKVLPSHASRNGVIAACEKSLARLKTDRLDCYLLHWRGNYPLQETVAGFEKLQQAGKIRGRARTATESGRVGANRGRFPIGPAASLAADVIDRSRMNRLYQRSSAFICSTYSSN